MGEHTLLLEILGWTGTLILVLSYLMKERMNLHIIALISTCMKFVYCYYHQVWPLFANWGVLILLHTVKIFQLYKERKAAHETKGSLL